MRELPQNPARPEPSITIRSDVAPIPVKRIKEELGKIYQVIGRKATAKATDVEEWFDIKETQKLVKGKNTRCIMLLRKKLIRVFED